MWRLFGKQEKRKKSLPQSCLTEKKKKKKKRFIEKTGSDVVVIWKMREKETDHYFSDVSLKKRFIEKTESGVVVVWKAREKEKKQITTLVMSHRKKKDSLKKLDLVWWLFENERKRKETGHYLRDVSLKEKKRFTEKAGSGVVAVWKTSEKEKNKEITTVVMSH